MLRMLPFVRKVLPYIKPYRFTLFLVFTQLVVINLCELLKPWPLKIIIDHVLSGTPLDSALTRGWSAESLLLGACAGLVLIYLLLAGLTLLYNYDSIRVGQRLVNDLRRDLYDHLQRLSLAFHSRQSVGDLLYRVTADTYALQSLTMKMLFPILSAGMFLIGVAVIMFRMDAGLTLLALSVCPALFVTISRLNERISIAATQARQKEGQVYSVVQGALTSMRVIQAFTKEDEEHQRFMAASQDSLAASLRLYTLQTVYSGAVGLVIAVGTALVVWMGARHVLSGTLSIGDLVVFISYLASLYGPINNIVQTNSLIQDSKAGVQRVFEILDVERDIKDGHKRLLQREVHGEVIFDNIVFEYLPGRPVLQNIRLHAKPGQKIALVGPTGAGKSTLLSLLPRFYDPRAGRVLLDGMDVRQCRLQDLRSAIALVLQPPLVFPLTLRENIAYGRMDASLEEIQQAAQLARIHDFIVQLPEGYDTMIGEQGVTLSEGERQRITIARALLRNAPILILDEPTSSIDIETERLLMAGLESLMAGKTTFIIAHRLSSVRSADLIVVMRDGRIVELGTFGELLRRDSYFRRLYRAQWQQKEWHVPVVS
jgi:ATP-binding cassette, subfamily B, bacterial